MVRIVLYLRPFSLVSIADILPLSPGERRIRVITMALPTTTNLSEVFASADQIAIVTFFANKAVERSLSHKLEDSRDYTFQKLVELLIAYKTSMTSGGAGASAQLAISDNLKVLPVLVLGLLKNVRSPFCRFRWWLWLWLLTWGLTFRLVFAKALKYPLISAHTRKRC
jgi:hypothetical protein